MNVALWIAQAGLAVVFGVAGVWKCLPSRRTLVIQLPWVEDFPTPLVRFIGAAEIAAVLGLILPAATGVAAVLTPLAAGGLVIVMIGAIVTHARRRAPGAVAFEAVLLLTAAFVAWGRFGPHAL